MSNNLPIHGFLETIQSALVSGDVILSAAPGAGKSTALLLHLLRVRRSKGKILVLQPRRVIVRALAAYLAAQLNEPVGKRVGYQVRGEHKTSREVQLEFITEGILARRLLKDPELSNVDVIVFDEFHERSLHADFGFALIREVQLALRNDLRLMVMSATLAAEDLQRALPEAQLIQVPGRQFAIDYRYRPIGLKPIQLNELVSVIVEALQQEQGDVLVFLPGQKEINRTIALLEKRLSTYTELAGATCMPLYGSLSKERQTRALKPSSSGERKIVLATNIAESSLTIDGTRIVIDTGLERVAELDLSTGIEFMRTQSISQASATQRAGRAGRTMAGVCYRTWSKEVQDRLRKQSEPEVLTRDVSDIALQALGWGSSLTELPLLTQPRQAQLDAAMGLLLQLGAVSDSQKLSSHGRALVDMPVNVRLANMLVRARSLQSDYPSLLLAAAAIAALLWDTSAPQNGVLREHIMNSLQSKDKRVIKSVSRYYKQLSCNIGPEQLTELSSADVAHALTLAFPDWLAKHLGDGQYKMANGKQAKLLNAERFGIPEWLVAADLFGSNQGVINITLAEPVAADELLNWCADDIMSEISFTWSNERKQFELRSIQQLGAIILSQAPVDKRLASETLNLEQLRSAWSAIIRKQGLAWLPMSASTWQLIYRVQIATQLCTREDIGTFPNFSSAYLLNTLDKWLLPFIDSHLGLRQLGELDFNNCLKSLLNWDQQQWLDRELPTRITLPTEDRLQLEYSALNQHAEQKITAPKIAARMQWFYGLTETPTLAEGKLPIQVELLSPAMRPLQTTTDLGAFWYSESYRQIQKEMKGRYPKHLWPDDPANTAPTKVTKRKMF